MRLKYIGKEDAANGLKPGDIKDCRIETAVFVFNENKGDEFVSVLWFKEIGDTELTFKPYKSFKELFKNWEEVYD